MKLKLYLIAVIAITSIIVNGQNIIQGYILDKQTCEPLSYATIGALHQQYGSYTDTSGKFTLYFLNENDSLKVSYLGYKSLYTTVRQLLEGKTIYLEANPFQLKEVVVRPDKLKPKEMVIGFFTKKPNTLIAANYPLNVILVFIPFPEEGNNVLIKSVKFTYRMVERNYPIRVRILSLKTNGKPGDDIVAKNLIYDKYKPGRNQVADIDFSSENIYMPRNGVFVALEKLIDQRPPRLGNEEGWIGPYIGGIRTDHSDNPHWVNSYNSSKWVEVQSQCIIAIGLTVFNYED